MAQCVHARRHVRDASHRTAEEDELAVLAQSLHHLLGVPHRRRQPLRRVLPHAVEVQPGERAAVVADDDAVGVEHGDDLEDEVVA